MSNEFFTYYLLPICPKGRREASALAFPTQIEAYPLGLPTPNHQLIFDRLIAQACSDLTVN